MSGEGDNALKSATGGVALIGEVIKAAGNNPDAKEAANNLGKSAVTLTRALNNVLLPLAAINFACDKARVYFSEKFPKELAEKTKEIPEDCLIEPKASIAGPTLQGLTFTHEEPNLKEMYLGLLTTAMDGRVADDAHPAFVEIIKQMTSEEARLVKSSLEYAGAVPIVQIRARNHKAATYQVRYRHILNLREDEGKGEPVENAKLPAMIDNWVRLGLVDVDYGSHLSDEHMYAWVEGRPEFLRLSNEINPEEQKVVFQKGMMSRTELGKQFATAIGLLVNG